MGVSHLRNTSTFCRRACHIMAWLHCGELLRAAQTTRRSQRLSNHDSSSTRMDASFHNTDVESPAVFWEQWDWKQEPNPQSRVLTGPTCNRAEATSWRFSIPMGASHRAIALVLGNDANWDVGSLNRSFIKGLRDKDS
jgi:hypothetical protein